MTKPTGPCSCKAWLILVSPCSICSKAFAGLAAVLAGGVVTCTLVNVAKFTNKLSLRNACTGTGWDAVGHSMNISSSQLGTRCVSAA